MNKDQLQNREKLGKLAVTITGILGIVFFSAIAVLVFIGPQDWHVIGIRIRIDHWLKPMWFGILSWLLMLTVANDTPYPFRAMYKGIRKLTSLARMDIGKPGAGWLAFGLLMGFIFGYLFAGHYHYIFNRLLYKTVFILGAGLASGLAHYLFFLLTEKTPPLIYKDVSSWRIKATRFALYMVGWAAFLSRPDSGWEALGTEPILKQFLVGAGISLLLVWLLAPLWNRDLLSYKSRRYVSAACVVIIVAVVVVSWQNEKKRIESIGTGSQRVLLITVDTTRADYLSCYGYPRLTSPNMDKLAEEGVRFERAYCPKGITDPSHASILTGFYPRTHGLQSNHLSISGDVSSMAEVFQDKGYTTVAITSREHVAPSNLRVPGFNQESGPKIWMVKTSAREAYRRAANALLKYRDDKLFMWVHFFDPHDSYQPHPGYGDHLVGEYKGKRDGDKLPKMSKTYSEEEVKYMRDLYAGEIFYMDHYIGKLVELARDLEPVSDSPPLILIVGDHGEMLGEFQNRGYHFGFGHGEIFYNPVIQVPLIVNWPGKIKAGKVVSEVAEVIDVAPTILDFIFGKKDYPAQGMSLRPVVEEGAPSDGIAVMQCTGNKLPGRNGLTLPDYALIKGDYKIFFREEGPEKLFDTMTDWYDTTDISGEKFEKTEELRQELELWKERTPETKPEQREFSDQEIKALKALGYIE